ncbi:MAG: SDR family oxidoreductase [Candidatus Rokubacteria bacterium]|nr:SDR family oxidoreductase [Candidatus Rokubacteria bacterium]
MPELSGKAALVTGASSGIGAATARGLARAGMRVALLARRKERLEALAQEIAGQDGQALVCPGDVTEPPAVQSAVERMLSRWGRIDLLVNNAGRGLAAPFEATAPEELRAILEVNLIGVLTATQAVLPPMRKAGSGHIINVSSVVGRRGLPYRAAYGATKFALVGLTEALRQELRESGIHVSLVYPIYTTGTEFDEAEPKKIQPHRYGPSQSAEQVARAIVRCARHPRAEVYPYPSARILAVLSALAPGFVDWMMARIIRR